MEPYTLDRRFLRQDVIDGFHSIIWTERYYGDSSVELVVPMTRDMIKKLPVGTFLGLAESDEVMMIEQAELESGNLKVTGISLLSWLNNRFIRTKPNHNAQIWNIKGRTPGEVLRDIVYNMCVAGSPYLTGANPIGVTNPQKLAVPGLTIKDFDKTGKKIKVGIPYGPVYDAMREIAVTYEVGMKITLDSATETSYSLKFLSYRGLNRTSGQDVNPIIRFSPQMDSLTDVKELQSNAALKTLAYAFAPGMDPKTLTTSPTLPPGISTLAGDQYTGFDLRAQLVFASDVNTEDDLDGDLSSKRQDLRDILESRADEALAMNSFVQVVDGEIVPSSQFKYGDGKDYNLGDIIEVQGNSEVVKTSRVLEYIRSQDAAGEKAYPTVAMLD